MGSYGVKNVQVTLPKLPLNSGDGYSFVQTYGTTCFQKI